MNTLFTKILLWFITSLVITAATFIGLSIWSIGQDEDRRRPPFSMVVALQLDGAVRAYEAGGPEELALTLHRFSRITQGQAILTDATGRDLLTGEDRADLIVMGRQRVRMPFARRESLVMVRPAKGGQYWFIFHAPRTRWMDWFLQPEYLWVLGVVVLLCYLLAYHLTSPLRGLQRAVARFGSGELSARAAANRSDEFGSLAATFNRMADRIESLLAAERRLLLDISHELRSPLARLSLAVELGRSGADYNASLDRIQKEADRLNSLVGELLQVMRAETDPSAVAKEALDLAALIDTLAAEVNIEADARGVKLALDTQPTDIEGSQELLRRAIENVLRNAIRYAPAGTSIEITLQRAASGALIAIRDYGPGVPEESLHRIFDPFYRVAPDRDRASGGVGLGLSIARRAVELHGGNLRARNVNPGLLVEIQLPAVIRQAAPETSRHTPVA